MLAMAQHVLARLGPEERARLLASLPDQVSAQLDPAGSADPLDRMWGWPEPRRVRHRARRTPTYYRVRVDLVGAKPPIWRRLDLASNLTLEQVHFALQAAFSWGGHHLYEFSAGHRYDRQAERFGSEWVREEDPDVTSDAGVRLDHVLAEPGDKLYYSYDFGDDWYHAIALEQVSRRGPDDPPGRVVGGRRATPPDDCGGIGGYERLLEVIADPSDPEHKPLTEWFQEYGGHGSARTFDPATFDRDDADDAVRLALT